MLFITKISNFISRHQLLTTNGKYLVALSGGADSVALLLALHQLDYHIEAAHCNFHLRGTESDRDELFCEDLCKKLNIPFHRAHFDTQIYARQHHVSIEMAARTLRYTYFRNLAQALNMQGICVAHHQDDNAETILLHLVRGTGLQGLTGMKPRRDDILRPMLCVTRNEVLDFLHAEGQHYMTDSTNEQPEYQRNKLRLEVMPLLRELNSSLTETLTLTAQHLTEASRVLDSAITNSIQQVTGNQTTSLLNNDLRTISIPALQQQPSPAYTLYAILTEYGFNQYQIGQIADTLKAPSGRQWHAQNFTLTRDRNSLIISRKEETYDPLTIPDTGCYVIGIERRLVVKQQQRTPDFTISKDALSVTLDATAITFPLTLRQTQAGDHFTPYGMKGTKLVSDFLTDRKRSLIEKQRQLVITDAENRIIWLIGERIDHHFAVKPNTRNVLSISII